jgi:Spy/CpxP family protein refolding chaperone
MRKPVLRRPDQAPASTSAQAQQVRKAAEQAIARARSARQSAEEILRRARVAYAKALTSAVIDRAAASAKAGKRTPTS